MHASWPPGPPGWPGGPPRRRQPMIMVAGISAVCLIAAVVAGARAYAELVRKPTGAELSQAAATAVARRWQAWPAGRVFPAKLPFSAGLGVPETAIRVGIDHPGGCAAAVDQQLGLVLTRYGCRGVLRATYLDEREAVAVTIGVFALPDQGAAAAARARIGVRPGSGLRTLAIPATASAWFSDSARQAATLAGGGPYLVLTAAGYADGRPAAETAERRADVFTPAGELAQAVLAPLTAPATPRCGTAGWTC